MRAADLANSAGYMANPRYTGFGGTLIEVLAALTIMSSGMLGIAALYAEGLRSGRLSIHRVAAVQLAADMAERIRSNARGQRAYAGAPHDLSCASGGRSCTPSELAADDLFRWQLNIARKLPVGASGKILETPTTNGNRYQIDIAWPEGGVVAPLNYSLTVRVAATAR